MRNLIILGSFAALAACGGSNSSDISCGDGTTLVGDSCEPNGIGPDTTCGAGTHLDGTMCVPDSPSTGAPTISAIDPPDAGVSGNVLFTITGTNFAGGDISDLHVFFGDTTTTDCEATVGAATPTTIAGEVPPACDLHVTVTVQTNKGMATIPFQYDALFAADGDGGGNSGVSGDLYIIDPFATTYLDAGPIVDTDGTGYGITGLAFSSTGTLYGVTTGDSDGDLDQVSQLVTIAPSDAGAIVTVVNDLIDADENVYFPTDIKMSGDTLYGWAYYLPEGGSHYIQTLITIDPTGTVTPIGAGAANTYGLGGLAIDGTNTIYVAANGAGPDVDYGATGELDTVTSAGVVTAAANSLDWPLGAPIEAMTFVGSTLVGVLDNGYYGVTNTDAIQAFGESLVVIDPMTGDIEPSFDLPAFTGFQSAVDGIDIAPPNVSLARVKKAHWTHLNPAGTTLGHATRTGARASRRPFVHYAATSR